MAHRKVVGRVADDAPVRLPIARLLTVALVVLAVYGAGAIAIAVRSDPIREAVIGSAFLDQGQGRSSAIDALRGSELSRMGYDGQFVAYIALDPRHAKAYVDEPAYRYSRILYPLVVRAAALGRSSAVPWALVLVNVAAAILLTLAAAAFLERCDSSAWYALIAGLAPGLAFGLLYDLTEPLAYALAAVGALIIVRRTDHVGVAVAGLVFGLAALARETTLLFPLTVALALALGVSMTTSPKSSRRPKAALALLALACVPAIVWRAVLATTMPGSIAPEGVRPDLVPLRGLVSSMSSSEDWTQLLFVAIPAMGSIVLATAAIRRTAPWLTALALNVIGLVLFLPRSSWDGYPTSSRVTLGIPLAFVLCLPAIETKRVRLVVALVPLLCWLPGWVKVISDFSLSVSAP